MPDEITVRTLLNQDLRTSPRNLSLRIFGLVGPMPRSSATYLFMRKNIESRRPRARHRGTGAHFHRARWIVSSVPWPLHIAISARLYPRGEGDLAVRRNPSGSRCRDHHRRLVVLVPSRIERPTDGADGRPGSP